MKSKEAYILYDSNYNAKEIGFSEQDVWEKYTRETAEAIKYFFKLKREGYFVERILLVVR